MCNFNEKIQDKYSSKLKLNGLEKTLFKSNLKKGFNWVFNELDGYPLLHISKGEFKTSIVLKF